MLIDLARAILVAILVTTTPGYLWQRALFHATNRVESATITLALSLTLVPAAALLLCQLFGTPVTFTITLASLTFVTVAGWFAYAMFGRAPALDAPAPLEVPRLGTTALLVLIFATAIMMGVTGGLLENRVWYAPLAVLMIATAVVYVVETRRKTGVACSLAIGVMDDSATAPAIRHADGVHQVPESTALSRILHSRSWRRVVLGVVLILVLLRSYGGPIFHDWPYIRGQDLYAHSVMVNLTMNEGVTQTFLIYPPGFHILSAVLSRLSGLAPLELYPVLAPALLLLPALSCYVLARRLFGPTCGIAAALFAGLLLRSPYVLMRDGMYPNLIAAQFLLVLTLVAFLLLVSVPTARAALLLALLGSSVVLYHSVAALYLAALLVAFSVLIVLPELVRDRVKGLVLVYSVALMAVLSLFYIWDAYNVPKAVSSVLGITETSDMTNQATMVIGTHRARPLFVLPRELSQPVTWFGLLGALLLVADVRMVRRRYFTPVGIVLAWGIILFVGTQTSLSGFPIRFMRDLGLPLSVLAAPVLVSLLRWSSIRRPVTVLAATAACLLVTIQANHSFSVTRIRPTDLFMTTNFDAAGKWLMTHNEGGNIIVSPHFNQVPANAMLAMGGYSGLPAYTKGQLRNPRTVPGKDQSAVADVLWVLGNPSGDKTKEIHEARDVRYVVLYKRFPSHSLWHGSNRVRWQSFVSERGLYRLAYENRDVIILRVL